MKHVYTHLSKDPRLQEIISSHPPVEKVKLTSDLFVDVLGSIVSQQLSTKAADTIWKRFELLFPDKKVTPEALLRVADDDIRASGISYPKIKYMKGFAESIVKRDLILSELFELSDDMVIERLTKVKGIGKWTAEMILMFSLGREDVFSLGDLGLRNAVAKLYEVDRDDLVSIEQISQKWKPYRTYAARYLWSSLDNKPITSSQT